MSSSWPLNMIDPRMSAVLGSNPMTAKELMDFPQPDSPTSPIVSPGRTQKDTLSTMSTSPWACGKAMDRSLTSRTGFLSARSAGRTSRSVRMVWQWRNWASLSSSSSSEPPLNDVDRRAGGSLVGVEDSPVLPGSCVSDDVLSGIAYANTWRRSDHRVG